MPNEKTNEKMITPTVLNVMYYISIFACVILGIIFTTQNVLIGVIIIGGGILVSKVSYELGIIVFKIYGKLVSIDETLKEIKETRDINDTNNN